MAKSYSLYFRSKVNTFVLLFVGRTGSSYIISKLNSHLEVKALGEKLVNFMSDESGAQIRWVDKFFFPPLVGRNKAIGFKAKLVHIFDPDGFAQVLRENKSKVIFMRRQNHVKAVVSRINAERFWERYGQWNLNDETNRLPPFAIDPDDFEMILRHISKLRLLLKCWNQYLVKH